MNSKTKISIILHFIRELGHTNIILQTDHAYQLNQLLTVVCDVFKRGLAPNEKRLGKVQKCMSRSTAGHSSNANGAAERAIRQIRDQIRVMAAHFEEIINEGEEIKDKWFKIKEDHELFIYMVRHATWLINRCAKMTGPYRKPVYDETTESFQFKLVKKGMATRFFRLYGRNYPNTNYIFRFLQPVICRHLKDREKTQTPSPLAKIGLWLGRSDGYDSHIVLTTAGIVEDFKHTVRAMYMHPKKQLEIITLGN